MESTKSKLVANGDGNKKKKRKVDWVCVNPNCTKSNPDNVVTAKPFVMAYYGAKENADCKRKICEECYVQASLNFQRVKNKIVEKQPFYDEPLPIICNEAVVLDDSDEEDERTDDDSDDSEVEFELGDGETLEDIIAKTMEKLDIPQQIEWGIENVSQRLDTLSTDASEIDAQFAQIEKDVDALRTALYAPFKPEVQFLDSLTIQDTIDGVQILSSAGAKTAADANLPPMGQLTRPPVKNGQRVISMRGKDILGVWDKSTIYEISQAPTDASTPYKVKFDPVVYQGRQKQAFIKKLSLKNIAYFDPAPVRLQVGTRIIAIYVDPEQPERQDFYSGIIAEPPKTMNSFRYLVFFDDGYASYIKHEDIRVVCQQTDNAVWEDVHSNSRDFVKKYLQQYPERPMVKLSLQQTVSVELEGSWWNAKVEAIDASLVKVIFVVNQRKELIYRGSTRLFPLYKQMQQQKKNAGTQHFARRNHGINRGGGLVEWTRNDEADDVTPLPAPLANDLTPDGQPVKRAVARKSTTATKRPDQASLDAKRIRWESKGTVKPLDVDCAESCKFAKHQCTPLCIDDPKFSYDPEKYVTKDEKLKHFNTLLIPIILGWKREITKHKNAGKRAVYYVSPCGRRLRDLEEIHRYLRVTHSTLEIDFYNFDWYVHVFNYFTPERHFCKIDDISYGKENTPVSCVNSLDNNYPEYVEYSTERLPQKGVQIPLDEGFLTCCDCTDDCQDKSKCSCWQLTINTTAAEGDGLIKPNSGYVYRRLHEPVPTGIYECNKFCKCKETCLNRVAQKPLRTPLQVFKTERRGWGIRTLADIPRGGFVCIYVGNLYSNDEANKQGQDFGDEYFAELDLIEVVEGRKEGYESDYEGEEPEVVNNSDNDYQNSDQSASSEDDLDDRMDMEDREYKAKSGHNVDDNDVANKRQTRTTKKPKNNGGDSVETEEAKEKAKAEKEKEKEEKPKHKSTRKFYHEDEDFYVMDAKSIGNIGRYLNHSCNPNCFVQNCFVDTHDLRFPWVSFFALSHITAGEELCWDYNYQVDQVQGKEIYCQCGAESCRGRLL